MKHGQKEIVLCDLCGSQFLTNQDARNWCTIKCRVKLDKILKDTINRNRHNRPAKKPVKKYPRNQKVSLIDDVNKEPNVIPVGHSNYYWILSYAKGLRAFFASDIESTMKADDIYFSLGVIKSALEYWVGQGVMQHSDTTYVNKFGGTAVRKYIYIKDPA